MQLIDHTKPKMIIADEGKHIRSKDDVYVPEHTDEEGNIVPEHIPYYSTSIYVPDSFTEKQMHELYVEKGINEPEQEEPNEPEQEELTETELKAQAYDIITGEVE